MAAAAGGASAENMAAWREQFGLDQSIFRQLLDYIWGILRLDLGVSPLYNEPVLSLILGRLPASLLLMATGLVLAALIGITLGTFMALSRGGWVDRILSLVVLLLYSVPGFWVGLMLIILFSVQLGWLPSGGFETIGVEMTPIPAPGRPCRSPCPSRPVAGRLLPGDLCAADAVIDRRRSCNAISSALPRPRGCRAGRWFCATSSPTPCCR